ncbi:hypothetical protein EDB81DRAFT_807427 [Dactylonectria macrodidyma]|uniref:2EXR domain-containing protein n=1 Tax=Dactylonectria macrodidyma TaxID=307937 RepID=A0A9P9E6W5_9HYPO|nr:hypothetical protein EDB81DRAFT_807427 [Dactylonectria macrodidyma]
MAVRVGDESEYELVRIRFAQIRDDFLRHQQFDHRVLRIPQKYWLQYIFIRPFIGEVGELYSDASFHPAASSQDSSPITDEKQMNHAREHFPQFIRLPTEVQIIIWLHTIPTHQITRIKHSEKPGLRIQPTLPVALSVCRQSRHEALRHLEHLPLTDEEKETRKVPCDVKTGILQCNHREYDTEHPGAKYSWCLIRGPHSHLNDQSHPWKSFRTISDLL